MGAIDPDLSETTEWLEALQAVQQHRGPQRTTELVGSLLDAARRQGVVVPQSLNTPYCNTIPPEREDKSPGDRAI